jgi:hypothetical protein
VVRASLEYVRDTIEITRGDHDDLLDAQIFTAALDANMGPVKRTPDLWPTYGGARVSTPDDLRRPVSISALAHSLCLPFETVRRRVLKMACSGLCVICPQGVIVPHCAVTSKDYVAQQRARFDRARGFYDTLRGAGALPTFSFRAASMPPPAEPPVRAANWAFSEYTLRACSDLIALTGNMMSSRILLELVLANTRSLANDALAGWASDPMSVSQPVRIAALADPLRISSETVRRHLHVLKAIGFCRRRAGGLVAVAPASVWPRLLALVEANETNVQRLLTQLRHIGVLTAWEAMPAG